MGDQGIDKTSRSWDQRHQRTTQDAGCIDTAEEAGGVDVACSMSGDVAQGKRTRSALRDE